jgi:hypothetical protein
MIMQETILPASNGWLAVCSDVRMPLSFCVLASTSAKMFVSGLKMAAFAYNVQYKMSPGFNLHCPRYLLHNVSQLSEKRCILLENPVASTMCSIT